MAVVEPLPSVTVPVPEGISAVTSARNVGVAELPVVGPASTVLAVCVTSVGASVPELVTGEPGTVELYRTPGIDKPTLVTVPLPPPPAPQVGVAPAPPDVST